jgi:hypothetical protein
MPEPAKPTKAAEPAAEPKDEPKPTPDPAAPEGGAAPEPEHDPEPEPEPPKSGKDDPLLAALFDNLKEPEIKKVEDPEPEPEPDPKPEPKPEGGEPAAKPEPPAEPPAKKKKKAAVLTAPEPTSVVATAPPAPEIEPDPAPEPKEDPDAAYIAGLTEEQQEELAEAEWAEKNLGERHKGRRKQLIDFYRTLDASHSKLLKDKPDRTFDENDEEFQAILKRKPVISGVDQRKIIKGMAKSEALAEARTESEGRLAEIERTTRKLELTPKVEEFVEQWTEGVDELLLEPAKGADGKEVESPFKTVMEAIQKDPEAALEEYPLEAKVIQKEAEHGRALAREMALFNQGVGRFDEKNPLHMELSEWITREGQIFKEKGGEARVRDGKKFVTRAEYIALARQGKVADVWTFSDEDTFAMLANRTRRRIEAGIRQVETTAKQFGFEKRPKKNSASAGNEPPKGGTPATRPPDPPAPKATPRPSKGAAAPKPAVKPGESEIDIVAIRGLR